MFDQNAAGDGVRLERLWLTSKGPARKVGQVLDLMVTGRARSQVKRNGHWLTEGRGMREDRTRADDRVRLRRRVVLESRRLTPLPETDFALDRKNDRDARMRAA